jgi:ACS family sodium-dependent inorganic phosphate cotransporter
VFAILGCAGMAITYGLKVNLSVAIVAMVNQTAIKLDNAAADHHSGHVASNVTDDTVCLASDAGSGDQSSNDGPLLWSEPNQGLVLGSYFWGYLITQVPAGRLAEIYGGKWIFFVAIVINVVCTLLCPLCSKAGFEYLILMRILMGLGGGLTFPAMNVLVAEWAPKQERSTMSSIIYGGTSLGTVLCIPTAGIIAGMLGWEAVFYIHGGVSAVWLICWAVFVSDDCKKHPFISEAERTFILENHAKKEKKSEGPAPKLAVPWKEIFTSVPFWALMVSHTLNNFGWYMLLVELPSFMSAGLGFNIKENALLSAVPFLCNWIYSIVYSRVLDMIVQRGLITTTVARKISMGIASIVPALCLIGVCLSGCNKGAVVAFMIVATLFYGSMFAGVFSNHVDIASNYAGVLMGITNMAATIPGFLVPALVGILTHGKVGLTPWHTVFYLTSGLLGAEFLIFTIFATSIEQPWNRPKGETEEEAAQRMLDKPAVYH